MTQKKFKTYRLMYFFGTWITRETFAAENDKEAIFDATMSYNNAPAKGQLAYALFQGNRRVKDFK